VKLVEKYNKIWDEIKNDLENDLDNLVFTDIFAPVNTVFKVVNNYIYIVAPNDFVKKRIEMLYLQRLDRYLENKFDEVHKFRIMTEDQADKELSDTKDFSIVDAEPNLQDKYLQGNLNASYNFDSFVVGNSNRLAYTSGINVA